MANSTVLFSLEHSDHESDMMEAFYEYLRDEAMVDVMLHCDGNIIKAHRMVLSAGSPYFRNIFDNIKNPLHLPVIIIKDMPFRDLKTIVEFLYRGHVVIPEDQIDSLAKSAQTLYIKGLDKYFKQSARANLTGEGERGNTSVIYGQNGQTSRKVTSNRSEIPVQTPSYSRVQMPTKNSPTKRSPAENKRNITIDQKPKLKNFTPTRSQNTSTDSKTTNMRLRNTHRPDYYQLSNGDFSSDDSVTEIDSQQVNYQYQSQAHNRSDRLSHVLKQELISKNEQNGHLDTQGYSNNYQAQYMTGRIDHSFADPTQNTSMRFKSDQDIGAELGLPRSSRKSIRQPDIKPIMSSTPRPSASMTNIKLESDQKPELFRCTQCPRIFCKVTNLKTHVKRIHQKEEKTRHVCTVCGREYSWRSGLYKHMKVHKT